MNGLRLARALAGAALLTMVLGVSAANAEPAPQRTATASSYIVLYERSVDSVRQETDDLERTEGFRSRYRYSHAVKGFAARLSSGQVAALRADPQVRAVVPDYPVQASETVSGDVVPTGVKRLDAGTDTAVHGASGVNVAVIDTGVDLTHPDLNAVSGKNCITAGASANDDNGHGSHVAGTIGARNNGSGVAGVAAGTRIYAVKVLNASGSGTQSSVICGIDWVAQNSAALNIKVANMSLGGLGPALDSCPGSADPEHVAICNATSAGVLFVVAAGNDAWDFDYAPVPDVPAAYPEVLTVTALSDSDGKPGATGGAPACRTTEADDRPASFSNYALTAGGKAHAIAAPGVCIDSTWMNGGRNTISGTSMATPHMAGAAAICLNDGGTPGSCAGMTPAQMIAHLRATADAYNGANPSYGFTGDPLHSPTTRYYGYLAHVGQAATGPPPPPDEEPPAAPASLSASGGDRSVALSWEKSTSADVVGYRIYRNGAATPVGSVAASAGTWTDTGLAAATTYTYSVKAYDGTNESPASPEATARTWSVTSYRPASYTRVAGTVYTGGSGSAFNGALARLFDDDAQRLEISAARLAGNSYRAEVETTATIADSERGALKQLSIAYDGNLSAGGAALRLLVLNAATGAWVTVSGPTTSVTSDRAIAWQAPGAGTDYVSAAGQIKFRVLGTRTSSFRSRTDMVRFTVKY